MTMDHRARARPRLAKGKQAKSRLWDRDINGPAAAAPVSGCSEWAAMTAAMAASAGAKSTSALLRQKDIPRVQSGRRGRLKN